MASRTSRRRASRPNGPLAQLAEHLTFNQGVAGSSPARPTLGKPTTVGFLYFGLIWVE